RWTLLSGRRQPRVRRLPSRASRRTGSRAGPLVLGAGRVSPMRDRRVPPARVRSAARGVFWGSGAGGAVVVALGHGGAQGHEFHWLAGARCVQDVAVSGVHGDVVDRPGAAAAPEQKVAGFGVLAGDGAVAGGAVLG